ncbi:hypothetical protein INR49_024456 [Caranx melampygus]|nr:hypothetical protein INR49_024456 [Caranx melampygus]
MRPEEEITGNLTPAPDSSRHTSHTGKENGFSGLGYGFGVAWDHLRPFIPFFLISFMVVALVYLMQAIIYGGPFKDPLFFVKFNERWPRPTPAQQHDSPAPTNVFSPVPSSSFQQVLFQRRVDGEMWCYQKPGFGALLLAELQRQQQCSQFCDTLLKAEGQSRLLDFRALGACTLLHMVRLLYSGEMAGEGEKEKEAAISAAAKLGIHGLVEVKKSDDKKQNEVGGGQHTEVGVQTEPLMLEQNGGRRTEELQVDTAPPTHSAATFETIDITSLQGVVQTDTHLPPPQIPYVPVSLIYPPQEDQTPQPSSAPAASMHNATTSVAVIAPPYTPVPPTQIPSSSHTALCATDPHNWWTGPQGAGVDVVEGEEWEGEQLELFQGNIPGFINYFLNPEKEEHSRRARPRRRRGAGVGAARRAGTGERRARRPRARTGGRGRGRLMQTVDVQDVGVSKVQKLFLQRWGRRSSMTGQGGGAAGRKLFLKTREFLKPTRSYQRRRKGNMAWEFSQSGDSKGGGAQCGGGSTSQQIKQRSLLVGSAQSVRAKAPVSFPSTSMQFYNVHTLTAPTPSFQATPSPIVLSTEAHQVSPALSLLHTTSLPPPAPLPPQEDQPEHIERLLEEVMMRLDILPANEVTPHSQPPILASSSSCTYTSPGNLLAQNKQQGCATGLLQAGPGSTESTEVVSVVRGGSGSSSGDVPVLQQQGEGPLDDMLDHFLQSFEQHVNNCASEEGGMDGESSTEPSKSNTVLDGYTGTKTRTTTDKEQLQNTHTSGPVRNPQKAPLQQSDKAQSKHSKTVGASACLDHGPLKNAERKKTKKSYRRRKSQYLFSLEKRRVRKQPSVNNTTAKIHYDQEDKQLQKMPVVKLERGGPLAVRLQEHSCRSLEVRDAVPCLEENRSPTAHKPGGSQGRSRNNGQLVSLSNDQSSTPPQLQPVESCGMNGQLEEDQERGEELTIQPQEEAEGTTTKGEKRGAESEGEMSNDATVVKRFCSVQMSQSTSETCIASSESADFVSEQATTEADEVIDVETVLLTGVGEEPEEKDGVWREITLRETEEHLADEESEGSSDEIINVDGLDAEKPLDQAKRTLSPPSHTEKEISARSTGSWEEEVIDVTGGSSPVPDPEVITWTDASEGEEEDGDKDVDVVGEKTGYASSMFFAAMIKSELIDKKLKTEVL